MINLDKRLSAVYALVRENIRAADIGTDHGYLICRLLKDNKISHGFACDVNEGPLKNAKKTAQENNVQNISFVLCDGLIGVPEDKVDDVIIAGMGGELISKILSDCAWVKNKHLILQPMTKESALRRYLYENGFFIEKETAVKDKNHHYCVMSVYYNGRVEQIDEIFAQIGKITPSTDEAKSFILNRAEVFKKRAAGLLKTSREESEKNMKIYNRLKEIAENENT